MYDEDKEQFLNGKHEMREQSELVGDMNRHEMFQLLRLIAVDESFDDTSIEQNWENRKKDKSIMPQ